MYWCYECGDFTDAVGQREFQWHSEVRDWESSDTMVCSSCGSEDITSCEECEVCGYDIPPDVCHPDIRASVCEDCLEMIDDEISVMIERIRKYHSINFIEVKRIIYDRLGEDDEV